MKNRSENSAERGQILPVLQVNSRSIDQKSGEIWTAQADLQPISFKSDRLLGYAELATLVTPVPIAPMILDDPDDDHVLACALTAQADLIVSGDRHLLGLKTYQGIRIVTASEALQIITA
ncbi:MAG: PIN domain-containing protein [Gallionella sp.]|nr:PIN domain-containing protein [Gallionella sp.]